MDNYKGEIDRAVGFLSCIQILLITATYLFEMQLSRF